MSDEGILQLAEAWVGYQRAPKGSEQQKALWWSIKKEYDLRRQDDDPDSLWKLILAVHQLDRSVAVQQVLSAGPLEDLLGYYGERFIDLVEMEARRDPSFAWMLGGVWQGKMSDAIWGRLRAVWDRRGWDGIPK